MEAIGRAGARIDEESAPLLPARTKFSWSIVGTLLIYTVIINASSELVWPFINQMILDVGVAPDEKSVGFYFGLIQTMASACSFATIMPGSFVADRWGRKVVLCSTLIGTSVGLSFFGVSKTLSSLIFFRCIGYALGPQLGQATAIIILGDVLDPSKNGVAFSEISAAYRIGQLFSPIFARILAHPKDRYRWFQSEFWEHNPYALPCWAGATTCIVALCIVICYIPETAPLDPKLNLDERQSLPAKNLRYTAPTQINDEPTPTQKTSTTIEPVARTSAERPRGRFFTPHITQLLISSWIMFFMNVGFFTLFPLWAFTPISSGGLGASEVAIASFISTRSIIKVMGLIPFAYFETRLGAYRLYAYSMTIFTVSGAIAFPLLNVLAARDGISSLWFNLAMISYFVLISTGNYCIICMEIMINQAIPSPQDLAQLVGISQTVFMLGQCMAPITVLSTFELSIKSDLLGGNVIWFILAPVSLIASAHSFMLRPPCLTNN